MRTGCDAEPKRPAWNSISIQSSTRKKNAENQALDVEARSGRVHPVRPVRPCAAGELPSAGVEDADWLGRGRAREGRTVIRVLWGLGAGGR